MSPRLLPLRRAALALLAAAVCLPSIALAQNAERIRKNLSERMPDFPAIDEITKTPIPGLYEVRVGTEIFYSDENGDYLMQGELYDTRTRSSLTQARIDKLTRIDFAALPLKDAIVWKQGSGKRRIAVFADPNCGYCKRFERTLTDVKDVTVYTFVIPILGPDSTAKAKDIWCAKDRTATWRAWMVDGKAPVKNMGACDTGAIDRNTAMSRKFRVNGTPAVVFEDGSRVPGAIPAEEVEKKLATVAKG